VTRAATTAAGVAAALALIAGAQVVRGVAADQRSRWPKTVDAPYAPSPAAAPYASLGYRELAADLFWIRTKTYFGDDQDTAQGFRDLIEAVIALDPTFPRPYEFAARAIGFVDGGSTTDDQLWAIAVLERGMARFPDDWKLPHLAGEIYLVELETDDPKQRAEWDEKGALLLEHAIRMPGAPRRLATFVANVRTQLGQHERAVRDLRELIATTDDEQQRRRLIEKLAALEGSNAERIADEARWERERSRARWMAAVPEVPESFYVILGDPPKPYIDFGDLAVDRALVGTEELYEPLPED
jgi:hypothetical protein